MKRVSKEEFENFINSYNGKLASHDINFTTPSSTIYCDFDLHPEMNPGLERIGACLIAEHIYPNPYKESSDDEYYINKNYIK